jgi:hypothetical protein
MTAESDKFVIATFALWAGDFGFAEELLRGAAVPLKGLARHDRLDSPEDIIRTTAALRLRQLWQRRGEFRKVASEERGLVDAPLIISGTHLRGAVWRIGERNFEMHAYLIDLAWERELFVRARQESDKHRPIENVESEEEATRLGNHPGRELSWTVVGNPFMQVHVADLALIEVSFVWVAQELPHSVEEVTTPLSGLIRRLDE